MPFTGQPQDNDGKPNDDSNFGLNRCLRYLGPPCPWRAKDPAWRNSPRPDAVSEIYTSPKQVTRAFENAEEKASDPREKLLIRLVSEIEICLFSASGKADASKCVLNNTKKYGYYSRLAEVADRKLSQGNQKVGPLVKCGVDELRRKRTHTAYEKCLNSE